MARHLITAALPHVTGIGSMEDLVCMLPADVYARYLRQGGHDVLFVCATDEHGMGAELAAAGANQSVSRYCAQQHQLQQELGKRFLLSWDHLGRSSSAENHELTRHFADSLDRNGFLEERETEQVFSRDDNRYLSDHLVLGTCPQCAYARARGDRCPSCGTRLRPADLLEPESAISGTRQLEVRRTKQLFLRESEFDELLPDGVRSEAVPLPRAVAAVAGRSAREVPNRCVTRDLGWGVPVGWPGFEGKVFDLWFDAPIEYIGATYEWSNRQFGEGSTEWLSWWFDADDVTYTQFLAEETLPSRTLSFASTIIGSWEPWKLPDYVKGLDRLTYYGSSFPTSTNGVFLDEALDLLTADCWRWFLFADAPESGQVVFTWKRLSDTVNLDLVGGFSRFVSETFTLAHRVCDGRMPSGAEPAEPERALTKELASLLHEYTGSLTALQFGRAAAQLRTLWELGNTYLDSTDPWSLADVDPVRCRAVLRTALHLAHVMAVAAEPVLPSSAAAVLRALHLAPGQPWELASLAALDRLPAGHHYEVPDNLFRQIPADEVAAWERRFAATVVLPD